ncbi:MAG: hypothetical protein R3263_04270, partial [Myxococcota bacterium]|nr:hypothetical protein [Myxococcota bacterium]
MHEGSEGLFGGELRGRRDDAFDEAYHEAAETGETGGSPDARASRDGRRPEDEAAPGGELELRLLVRDPEVQAALAEYAEGRPRQDFALTALRIGVLALRQAEGRLDADRVRRESERWLAELARHLGEHQRVLTTEVAGTLREYFDPESGRFHERVERLVRDDGELAALLRRQVGAGDSELARTLAHHLGEESPLMRWIGPEESGGFLGSLRETVDRTLAEQRERILAEFSLDNKEGALARLVSELGEHHGELGRALDERVEKVMAEFSLDREDSALSRLVSRVEGAHQRIQTEFSLDQEQSALARMRRELLEVLDAHRKGFADFQQEVRGALEAMKARREAEDRGTRHGDAFEAEVFRYLQRASQGAGDVAVATGQSTGRIRHCKVGDAVIELGPESAAPGARIVVEAKEKERVTLRDALKELEEGRKNRDAQVGLFVFSRRVAPEGLQAFGRYGQDVIVVWDAEDPAGDVFLDAGLSVARALCSRAAVAREEAAVDLPGVDRAIRHVEKQARSLTEVETAATTIQNGSQRILDRVRIAKRELLAQVAALDEQLD